MTSVVVGEVYSCSESVYCEKRNVFVRSLKAPVKAAVQFSESTEQKKERKSDPREIDRTLFSTRLKTTNHTRVTKR